MATPIGLITVPIWPIWFAAPPETHSALLSAGPGAGPMLASAAAWRRLGAEYAEIADELAQLLGAVQAGTWQGPTAETFVAANGPYLVWLVQAGVNAAVLAARQETAAAAYTAALAAMPTLAELAGNHAVHGVLVATNFFGVNTIPITLNEADYGRMWVQAATAMSTYQAVAVPAALSGPEAAAAPQIVKSGSAADDSGSNSSSLPPDTENDILSWLQAHGYTDFYNNVIQPLINALANNPYLQSILNGFDPYLTFTGNPLSFLSPFNVAFALGYPMTISQYVAFLSETFGFIGADLTAAFASGNPGSIAFTLMFTAVEAIGTIITDTIALLKTLLESAVTLIPVMLPLMTAALAPLALAAPLPGLAGLAGLAALQPVPVVPVPPVPPPPLAAGLAPPPAPAPVPAPVTPAPPAPAAPVPAPPPPPPPPTPAGPPVVPAQLLGYLVGGLRLDARRTAATGARRRRAPEPDAAQEPAAAAAAEQARKQRRRRVKVGMLGRGYEYADLEPDDPVTPTERGAGPIGAGSCGVHPAGLTTLAKDSFGADPTAPMVPDGWGDEQ